MPILDDHTIDFFSRSPEQTRRVGMRLGVLLQAGDVICLQGELGSGKTTFVQGVAQGWGALDAVSSPTFILVNVYRRADQRELFHMDAYRLDSATEAEELDLESMLTQGPLLIEWPERLEKLIPRDRLWLQFEYLDDEQRKLRITSKGQRADVILAGLHQSMYGAG
jgi:tRNA threonylcarbamoyladenosine biosynthesis protein TsaE